LLFIETPVSENGWPAASPPQIPVGTKAAEHQAAAEASFPGFDPRSEKP
jgi:hypothetical protein